MQNYEKLILRFKLKSFERILKKKNRSRRLLRIRNAYECDFTLARSALAALPGLFSEQSAQELAEKEAAWEKRARGIIRRNREVEYTTLLAQKKC